MPATIDRPTFTALQEAAGAEFVADYDLFEDPSQRIAQVPGSLAEALDALEADWMGHLAGSLDILGWQFRLATNDIQAGTVGFTGIAVALLGRSTASGTVAAALLFGALFSGTSQRNLDPSIFEPELAGNLIPIIQGLVVLLVSADVLVLSLLRRGRGMLQPGRASRRALGGREGDA